MDKSPQRKPRRAGLLITFLLTKPLFLLEKSPRGLGLAEFGAAVACPRVSEKQLLL
jgi:hypothetical protein